MAQRQGQTIVFRPGLRRNACGVLLFGFGLALAAQPSAVPADQPSLEYRIKAAFLLRFPKFIGWPEPDPQAVDAPFTICVLGDDAVGSALAQMAEGETVNGRKLVVERGRREAAGGCQMIYIGKSEKGVGELVTPARRGVLTVGEGELFVREGGMIAFVLENRRVRFIVNLPATRNALLTVSSRLLSVAKAVEQ